VKGGLILEDRDQQDRTTLLTSTEDVVAVTPPISEDYWQYRVQLSDKQAIIGFPKFLTIGIGFAVEEADWNSNLPYSSSAEGIYRHIKHNKGDDAISDEDCIEAIRMIQHAIEAKKKVAK
jgi:hypothetical protein